MRYVDSLTREYLASPSGRRMTEERLISPVTDSADAFVAASRRCGLLARPGGLRAPSPSRFWASWRALEAAVHRADADMALGADPRLDPDVALDSLDFRFTALGWPGVSAFHRRSAGAPPSRPRTSVVDRTPVLTDA